MARLTRAALAALALLSLLAAPIRAYEVFGRFFVGETGDRIEPFRVLLNGGEQVTYARADGTFVFRDVAPGRYVIDIPAVSHLFSQYKVDVAEDGVVRAIVYQYPGAPKARVDYPIAVEPVAELEYFETREKFNIFGLIFSPSFLAIVVPIGLLYVLPKLSESMMDPDEFKKAQEELGTQNPSSIISGMFSGAPQTQDDSDDD